MNIIISPAKKMRVDRDSFPVESLPQFLPDTEVILQSLQMLSYEELKQLWKCNDKLAALNEARLQTMDLHEKLTPAILAYEGIQYQYMSPNVFTERALDYIRQHLRILSGFYGIVRPFDGVTPYRLEMQAKLSVGTADSLYAYWGSRICEAICTETDCILNLASKEYSVCVSKYLPESVRMITCVFGEKQNGKILEKGTLCKMARGDMVRFLAEQQVDTPEGVRQFCGMGFHFSQADSSETEFVFLKEDK